ncbi:hypothetical protein [Actinoplanes sp. L3-i22]|uniref:hypothetical protein n=1 Tax=Actinoplanes sp. L3-i22 TaxID=2836373 RepID=UPI001C753932|nr:hypothetical protein [Actinoplanes sp. L3-i22]BCY06176.1 hypothetical protein L3i22_012640 [Actinoplanes sp. L3-i22]
MSEPGQNPPTSAPPADGPHSSPGADDRQVSGPEPIEIQVAPFGLMDDDEPGSAALSPARRRTRSIALASLLAVGVAGVAALGWFYWQVHSQRTVTLTTPATIGELTLDTSPNAQETADYLQTALSAEVDLDNTVSAVYSGAGDKDVLFFGGTTLIWSPGKDLETSFDLFADDQGSVTGLHDVDAGPLGGSMKCGNTVSEGKEMAVCGWADHGSLALAMFPGRSESEAAPLMRQFRKAIQTRD